MNPLEEILSRITSRVDYLKCKTLHEDELGYGFVGKELSKLKARILLHPDLDIQNYCNETIAQIDRILNEDPGSFFIEYDFYNGEEFVTGRYDGFSYFQNELNEYKLRLQDILDLTSKKTLTVSFKKVNKIQLQATISELAVLINLLKEIGFVNEKTSLKDMSNTFSEVFLRSDGTPIGKSTLVKECSSLDFSGYCKFGERYLDTIKEKYKELKSKTESKKNAATRPSSNRK